MIEANEGVQSSQNIWSSSTYIYNMFFFLFYIPFIFYSLDK